MSPKTQLDAVAIITAGLSFFAAIPWPMIAGFLSCVYLAIRIGLLLWDRYHGKPSSD